MRVVLNAEQSRDHGVVRGFPVYRQHLLTAWLKELSMC
jgi:hypothetical protein